MTTLTDDDEAGNDFPRADAQGWHTFVPLIGYQILKRAFARTNFRGDSFRSRNEKPSPPSGAEGGPCVYGGHFFEFSQCIAVFNERSTEDLRKTRCGDIRTLSGLQC